MKLNAFENNQIYRENLVWLMVAQAASIVPLLRFLPLWITAIWLLALVWRLLIYRGKVNYPGTPLKLIFALAAMVGIFLSYSGQLSAEPMVAFLVCSFVMKIIEMRTRKDALLVLFIAFIAISTQFLFAQDIVAGVYGCLSLLVLISAWASIFRNAKISVWQHLLGGCKLVMFSLPMMLVLFIIMPRLGPLWTVPMPSGKGNMGFSDSLRLGDVGELVRSPEVAFRAKFTGNQPPSRDLYWRGLVLDEFDGSRWTTDELATSWLVAGLGFNLQTSNNRKPDYEYSVILEPHYYRWLFSLGWPTSARSQQLNVESSAQGLLYAERPVFQKIEYQVAASQQSPMRSLSVDAKIINTRLPADHNPRATELAESWRLQNLTDLEIVNKALQLYASDFSYTLKVDQVRVNAIDYFLFESKRGFCEYFASSFVFLMRSAGIPARVVVGYQGGELNDIDEYFIVKQSDAHAWAEVWLADKGWVRYDPTSMVAPNRIEVGVDQALNSEDRKLLASQSSSKFLRNLNLYWDSMSYSWNLWILNFDADKQQGLLEWLLGSSDPYRVALAIAVLAILALVPAFIYHRWTNKRRYDHSQNRAVQPLLRKLQKLGITKLNEESFSAYLRRLDKNYTWAPSEFAMLADCYETSTYQRTSDMTKLRSLAAKCSKLIVARKIKKPKQ